MKNLEEALGHKRASWPPVLLRRLWTPLVEVADRRRTDAGHESGWFNLAGFLLRPGYGLPGDEIRVRQAWKLFEEGVSHPKESRPRPSSGSSGAASPEA